ncbi:MAG: hypothetical protein ACYC6Y_15155 [Thermoguttaceae bacterium]
MTYIDGDPTLQYGRRIWVPARSIMKSTCPIRIPDGLAPGTDHVELVSAPVDPSGGAEATTQSHVEAVRQSRPLIINAEPVALGILGEFRKPNFWDTGSSFYTHPWRAPPAPDDPIADLAAEGRQAEDLPPRMSILWARDLPSDPAALDAQDVLLVCTDETATDPETSALVRSWVMGGGYLWLMLDQLQDVSVSAMLGDAFTSTIVDRVRLSEVRIEDARPETEASDVTLLRFDEPVAFVRVVPDGVTVTDTVDGWPAAFWQPFGNGRVFVTTLGAAAWSRSAPQVEPQSERPPGGPTSRQKTPLERFVASCFSQRLQESNGPVDVSPILARQIGYRILGRQVVAIVLAAFCLVLAVAGAWSWRVGRPGHLLWTGPLAAAGASLVFLAVASTARNSVPPTAALWQRIELEPGVGTGRMSGVASLYNPETDDSRLAATRGGVFVPDMAAMTGRRRRMMWTDEGCWHWENLRLPPGIRTAPLEQVLHLESPVGCRAWFGPSGLTGVFGPGPFKGLGDAVIAVPHQPLLAARLSPGGAFTSGGQDTLAPGQFLNDSLVSDVQQRRADIYRLLLEHEALSQRAARPTFYVWSDPVETGFVFPQANRMGSALLSIPLELERTTPGSEVSLPAPFLRYTGVNGPDGERSTAYNAYRHEWAESQHATTQWLRFQVPECVLPLEVTRATLLLSVRAPSRSVEILALSDAGPVVVKTLIHPIGAYQVTLDRPDLLRLDEQGGLKIAVSAGGEQSEDHQDLMSLAPWKVESIQLGIAGRVRGE